MLRRQQVQGILRRGCWHGGPQGEAATLPAKYEAGRPAGGCEPPGRWMFSLAFSLPRAAFQQREGESAKAGCALPFSSPACCGVVLIGRFRSPQLHKLTLLGRSREGGTFSLPVTMMLLSTTKACVRAGSCVQERSCWQQGGGSWQQGGLPNALAGNNP